MVSSDSLFPFINLLLLKTVLEKQFKKLDLQEKSQKNIKIIAIKFKFFDF